MLRSCHKRRRINRQPARALLLVAAARSPAFCCAVPRVSVLPALITLPQPAPPIGLPDVEELSQEYTDVMRERMGSTALTYRHEDGMNYRCGCCCCWKS